MRFTARIEGTALQ